MRVRPLTSNTIEIDLFFGGLSESERSEYLEILNHNPEDPSKSTASIHFKWTWYDAQERFETRRWGGENSNPEDSQLPEHITQSICVTFLDALRDARRGLQPGQNSRIAKLLRLCASEDSKSEIEEIFKVANERLEANELVQNVEDQIHSVMEQAIGEFLLKGKMKIRASESGFDRLLTNMRGVMSLLGSQSGSSFELASNGLGYNNLLYIATVYSELEAMKKADSSRFPLLLIEEPEAHVHPQIQLLMREFFKDNGGMENVQTLLTTHSPTIVSATGIGDAAILYEDEASETKAVALHALDLTSEDKYRIERMLDITRATLLFAKGIIFVEGITEALLLPVIAERLGKPLKPKGISVVPVCGVDFNTLTKIVNEDALAIPTSIITDADPGKTGQSWQNYTPKIDTNTGQPEICSRTSNLLAALSGDTTVNVYHSSVTLEYDLALAGQNNAKTMARVWESCFQGSPRNLTQVKVDQITQINEKARLVWACICQADSSVGKGDFASSLTYELKKKENDASWSVSITDFQIPDYIRRAIEHVYDTVRT